MNLAQKKCIPCSGGVPAISLDEIERLKVELDSSWEITHNGTRLLRKLKLKNFSQSIKLANEIGVVAEEQWHHPELIVGFGHLNIEIWTHKINALVESDFIFAAKVDQLINNFKE